MTDNEVNAILVAVMGRNVGRFLLTETGMESLSCQIECTLRLLRERGDVMPNYWVFDIFHDRSGKVTIRTARNFAEYPMTEEEFERVMGRPPVNDDLHRVNCKEAGAVGHFFCGWCLEHQKPKFECGCYTPKEKASCCTY
jgi:hypothetical protein